MAEAAGDRGREIEGDFVSRGIGATSNYYPCLDEPHGVFAVVEGEARGTTAQILGMNSATKYTFSTSREAPTGATVLPRSWGALAAVYLGQPAQVVG